MRLSYDMSVLKFRGQPNPTFIKFRNKMIGCVTESNRLVLISPQGWVTKAKPPHLGGVKALPLVVDYIKTHEIEWVELETRGQLTERYLPTLKAGSEAIMLLREGSVIAKSLEVA